MSEKQKEIIKEYKVRTSFVVLLGRVIFVFIFLMLVQSFITNMMIDYGYEDLIFVKSLIINTFLLALLIYLILDWGFKYYLIGSEIRMVSGVIKKTKLSYITNTIQVIKLRQSFLGRILNYGNIILESSAVQNDIVLRYVPNPETYIDVIETIKHDNVIPIPTVRK